MRHCGFWLLTLAALGCAASVVCGQALPAPSGVTVTDDEKDLSGTKLLVSWKAPATAPAGMTLAGFRVFAQTDKEPAKVQELIADPTAAETKLAELKPWRDYAVGVTAFYVTAGTEFARDADAPNGLPADVPESQMTLGEVVSPRGGWFKAPQTNILVTSLLIIAIVLVTIAVARRRDMYIRPIAGLRAVDDAIGRATEMGRPILYVSGLTGVGDIATIAAMLILGHLARRTAAYETPILVPCNDPLVMAVQREIVHEAYLEAGKPDAYDPDNIFYVTDSQFGYVAAVDGIMLRQKPAANFYMGFFFAESLILAETGSTTGAIQIAGTDADTQLPFFITSCDYTLLGEEFYAAGAYLSRDPLLLAQLKGQDLGKLAIAALLVIGTILVTINANTVGAWFMQLITAQ